MPGEFLTFLLYLFYGMAFFAIGVSITSRDIRASQLAISNALILFALFAYSHAFHEWFELYQSLPSPQFPQRFLPLINWLKLILVFVSFGFLFLFGVRLLSISFPQKRLLFYFFPLVMLFSFLIYIYPHAIELNALEFNFINHRIRNFVGLPGAVCSGLGLIFYSRTVADTSQKGARNFIGAGCGLIVYGFLTGIVPSGTKVFFINLPIELLRGISAFVILHFVMNALYTFDEERKKLIEDRLIRFTKAEKLHALGKLAFGVAHEINNPLTNVSMNVELLKSDLLENNTNERTVKRFDTIDRNLHRASTIARELLSFSTEKVPDLFPTSLNDVIDSTLELLGSKQKLFQFTVFKGDIPDIEGIPWKLEEVLLNLLINAMDATPEGGHIMVRTFCQKNDIFLEIADKGKGIPVAVLDRVMDPFFTTKEVGQGTGLGLSICYGIMDMHGGTIELKSHEGQGTSVLLRFPRKDVGNGKNPCS